MTISRAFYFFAATAVAAAAAAPVKVTVQPPVITRHVYVPGHLPATVTEAAKDDLGVCSTQFGCSAQFRTEWTETEGRPVVATLTAVSVETRVTIDIWTAAGSGPAVAAHEETHRAISEHYYAAAETIARSLATELIGRTFTLRDAARRAVSPSPMNAIEKALIASYLAQTSARCRFAQERFDALTDHGRNKVANAVAMTQALAEERARRAR